MHDGVTHFQHTLQTNQRPFIDFVLSQQFGVVAEVAQEPAQLPHGSGSAIEAAGDQAPGQMRGFKHSETDLVIGFLRVPAILRAINPDKEQAIGDGVDGGAIGRTETLEVAPHAAPSFADR